MTTFASGGYVSGEGPTIGMLHAGDYIISGQDARRLGLTAFLDKLNEPESEDKE